MPQHGLGHTRTGRHTFGDPDIAADGGALAQRDAAEDGGTGVDHHVVFHHRVARQAFLQVALTVGGEAFCTQGDGLVHPHTLANFCRLTNHNTGAVVDEKAGANFGAGVDVDTRHAVCQLGHDTRQQGQAQRIQRVCNAVVDHGQNARVTQQHLVHTARRRVALVGGQHIAVEQAADVRQSGGKTAHGRGGLLLDQAVGGLGVAQHIGQFEVGLRQQRMQRGVERVADIKVFTLMAQIQRPQAHRKQRALELLGDLRQRLARRKLAPAGLA